MIHEPRCPIAAALRPLNLAIVTETYPPEGNGVAMTLGRLVEGLRRRGHAVNLVRPRQPLAPPSKDLMVGGFALPHYPGLRAGFPALGRLLRRWRETPPDVVHVATEGPLGWSAVRAALALRLPVSSGFHTNFHSYSRYYGMGWLQRPIGAYLRRLHNATDITLVPTRALAQQLAQGGYRNLTVLGRGVDRRLFHPARRSAALRHSWGVGDAGLAVIHVGRLAAEKNLPLVQAAFAAIRRRCPQARMVWVGDGPQRAALARAHPDHVFAGWRCGEELAAHYASGDLFLFPSLTETFGNVTLEALASGVPVVAYACAAALELVADRDNGMVVAAADETAYIAAASALAADSPRLDRFAANAASSVAGYDWDAVVAQLETIFCRLAGAAAQRRPAA